MSEPDDPITTDPAQSPVNIQEYFVLLIDVLGQQQHLSRWARPPLDGTPTEELVDGLRKSAGVIGRLSRDFNVYFEKWQQATENSVTHNMNLLLLSPGPDRERYLSLFGSSPKKAHFSDTFVVYAPAKTEKGGWSTRPLRALLVCACMLQLHYLARNVPLRGAICIGIGAEFPEIGFYGHALAEAHHLESKVAQYPRTVVSKGLQSFILQMLKTTDSGVFDNVIRETFRICQDLIIKDGDGQWSVHFLGQAFRELVMGNQDPKGGEARNWVDAAYNFVLQERSTFINKYSESPSDENKKLAKRYTLLKDYFDQHVANWGITPRP